jgi:hypothetical protein
MIIDEELVGSRYGHFINRLSVLNRGRIIISSEGHTHIAVLSDELGTKEGKLLVCITSYGVFDFRTGLEERGDAIVGSNGIVGWEGS